MQVISFIGVEGVMLASSSSWKEAWCVEWLGISFQEIILENHGKSRRHGFGEEQVQFARLSPTVESNGQGQSNHHHEENNEYRNKKREQVVTRYDDPMEAVQIIPGFRRDIGGRHCIQSPIATPVT